VSALPEARRRARDPAADGPPFTLNNAVDRLMKSEFDRYRPPASRIRYSPRPESTLCRSGKAPGSMRFTHRRALER
jgi:hypothetical protein